MQISGWDHPILGGTINHTGAFVMICRNTEGGWQVVVDTIVPQYTSCESPDTTNNSNGNDDDENHRASDQATGLLGNGINYLSNF